jgi:predicted esterase YcpF (UPF0227 family)
MDKTNILYLHGFNSSGATGTSAFLRSLFQTSFYAPDYDYIDPRKAEEMLDKIVLALLSQGTLLMVGKSLGGLWANYFAEKYQLKCILVNPGLQPHISLLKYLGTNRNFNNEKITHLDVDQVLAYEKFQHMNSISLYKHILLGAKDDVIDPAYCLSIMKEHEIDVFPELDHYFNDYNAIASAIKKAIK